MTESITQHSTSGTGNESEERKVLREQLLGEKASRALAFQTVAVRHFGAEAGIFIRQLLYRDGSGKDGNFWIYKSMAEWHEETGLARKAQEKARRRLVGTGVLDEEKRLAPDHRQTWHFRVNPWKLMEVLGDDLPHAKVKPGVYTVPLTEQRHCSLNGTGTMPARGTGYTEDYAEDHSEEFKTQSKSFPGERLPELDLKDLGPFASAKEMHDAVESRLVSRGYNCIREYRVPDRGDGRNGAIDLVAEKDGISTAMELDNVTPRQKSIFKLLGAPVDRKVVLLRRAGYAGDLPEGVDAVMLLDPAQNCAGEGRVKERPRGVGTIQTPDEGLQALRNHRDHFGGASMERYVPVAKRWNFTEDNPPWWVMKELDNDHQKLDRIERIVRGAIRKAEVDALNAKKERGHDHVSPEAVPTTAQGNVEAEDFEGIEMKPDLRAEDRAREAEETALFKWFRETYPEECAYDGF
jgi:hypothetical protein